MQQRPGTLVVLCLAVLPALASAETWRSIGPPGRVPVSSLAVHPTDPLHLLLGTANGLVFESRDAGVSWVRTPDGLPNESAHVALGPTTEWAGNYQGVWVRAAEDAVWTQVWSHGIVSEIVVDPTDDRVAWTSVFTEQYHGFRGYFLSRTVDGGTTWFSPSLEGSVADVLIDPDDPTTTYISLGAAVLYTSSCSIDYRNGGVYRATRFANSVEAISTGLEYAGVLLCPSPLTLYPMGGVAGIAIAATTPRTFVAAMSHGKHPLYRSTNEGASWTSIDGAFPLENIDVIRASTQTLYALGKLPMQLNAAVVRSDDLGDTWTTLYTVPGPGFTGGDLLVSGERLYVTTEFGAGLARSFDGGATWSEGLPGLVAGDVAAVWVDPVIPDLFLVGDARSTDGGATWASMTLPSSRVVSFAATPDRLYAATEVGVAASTDGGETWTPIPTGIAYPGSLAIDPASPSLMYGIDQGGLGLIHNPEKGSDWVRASVGSNAAPPRAVAVSTVRGSAAGAFLTVLTSGDVYRTAGADVWELVGALPTGDVHALVAGSTVDAGTWAATAVGVFHTDDAGATWSRIGQGFYALTVVPDPGASDVLYAASVDGVLRSIGGGAWQRFGTGLDAIDVRALAMTHAPKGLVAGTIANGAFRVTIDACGDGIVDAGESSVAEVRCGLPDKGSVAVCVSHGKGAARVRRRAIRLLIGAQRALDRAMERPASLTASTTRAERLLRRLGRVTAKATAKGIMRADCPAFAHGLERSVRLLAAGVP